MRLSRFVLLSLVVFAAGLIAQEAFDRDAYARDHVKFLVDQLAQWSKDFPQAYNSALVKPPVDASKLSEAAKGGGEEFAQSMQRLVALSNAKDLTTNAAFKSEVQKTVAAMKDLNAAMGSQRFPAVLQSDWDQIRSTLNSLARVYQVETLAVLEAPGGGGRGGRGGRGAAATATAAPGGIAPGGGLSGYIVDAQCATRGKGMWVNAECVARCVRDGDRVVLVTEEGKVYRIANQDKISPESYGQVVTLTGKTDGDTITVDSLKM
jgi:hypothetical protein